MWINCEIRVGKAGRMSISSIQLHCFIYTGGSNLSCTEVKPDSHLAQIFCKSEFHKFTGYDLSNNNWISQVMLRLDRFLCSQKIWLKWDPPVIAATCGCRLASVISLDPDAAPYTASGSTALYTLPIKVIVLSCTKHENKWSFLFFCGKTTE